MFTETGLAVYFWGVYVWYVLGFLAIAVPAIIEIYGMFKGKVIEEIVMQKEDA